MAYQVLALKFRPKTFDEVVAQKAAVTTLRNALRERRIAHGYIFSGVRGVGKTTLARIFAKALNCASGPSPDPCGTCDSCREVAEGRSMDVFEIDGASNSGVDKMRDLLEVVRYSPARDRYKIFIIDEFHQISRSAFNALLKTLEEPPPHVVFIMATTEINKVIPTIQSRCQQFDLRRIAPSEIAGRLRTVAAAEEIKVSDRTLALLARGAGGSMRDALTAMDQLIAACGNSIQDEDARAVLGVIPEEEVEAFFAGIAARDVAALLGLVGRLSDRGYDLVAFGSEIYRGARRLLLSRALPGAADVLDLSKEEAERSRALSERFGEDELLRILNLIEEAQSGLRFSAQPRFYLEALCARLARLGELEPIAEILSRLDSLGTGAPGGPAPAAAGTPGASRSGSPGGKPAGGAASRPAGPQGSRSIPPRRKLSEPESSSGAGPPDDPGALPLPEGASLFERVLARLEPENPTLARNLGTAVGAREEEGRLILPFSERSPFRPQIEQRVNLDLISRFASDAAGRPVTAKVVTISGGRPDARGGPEGPAGALNDRVLSDPAVRRVLDTFGARLVDVREKKQ